MMLDNKHMTLLKDPKNMRQEPLYQPEGYASDHISELENLAKYHEQKNLELLHPTRNNSAQGMMKRGLKYKFSLKDLNKYSKNLKFKDINWKLKLSALGKKIPDVKERKKMLIKGSHFNTLLKLLR
jgi:hypothetical protein